MQDAATSPDLRFDGQVAIVTGSGGGLGEAHARLLASRGANVVVNDNAPSGLAEQVVERIRAEGGTAVADRNTVATPEGGAAVIQTALSAFGHVDILVNNAGILTRAPFADLTPDLVRAMLAVSIEAAFNVTRPAWRRMVEQRYGRIVMTTSNAGWIGALDCAHYGSAKLGLVGLTNCLALEADRLHADGADIRVNAIGPRAISPMQRDAPSTHAVSSKRELSPELISPVVAWLSHRSCLTNGELFAASAGRVARVFFGLTPGFFDPELTPELVGDHVEEICSETGYTVPRTVADEVAQMLRD